MNSRESAPEAEPYFCSGVHVGHVMLRERPQCVILNHIFLICCLYLANSFLYLQFQGKCI